MITAFNSSGPRGKKVKTLDYFVKESDDPQAGRLGRGGRETKWTSAEISAMVALRRISEQSLLALSIILQI